MQPSRAEEFPLERMLEVRTRPGDGRTR